MSTLGELTMTNVQHFDNIAKVLTAAMLCMGDNPTFAIYQPSMSWGFTDI